MSSQPFLASISIFAGNFAPNGWALCNGQILPISQNTALFSLLGTTYGGNGTTTFALPDLQGRVPLGSGQGSGLSNYALGQAGGAESVSLTQGQLPAHSHPVNAVGGLGNSSLPTGALPGGAQPGSRPEYYSSAAPTVTMAPGMIGLTGSGQPVPVVQPYLAINYIIALQGIYPSRN